MRYPMLILQSSRLSSLLGFEFPLNFFIGLDGSTDCFVFSGLKLSISISWTCYPRRKTLIF
jgi:hypothetical protein